MSAGRVLVVDDEPRVVEVLGEFLRASGYEVTLALSGEEALRLLPVVRPHVVLLDLYMPGMDGAETLQRINAAHPGVRVIVATGETDIGVAATLLTAGAVDYVTKPFDFAYLEETVRAQIRGAPDPPA